MLFTCTCVFLSSSVVLFVCVCDIFGVVYGLAFSLALLHEFGCGVGCSCCRACVYAVLCFLSSVRLGSLVFPGRCVCVGAGVVFLSPLFLPFQSSILCCIALRTSLTRVVRLLRESVYHPPQCMPGWFVVGLFCCVRCLSEVRVLCRQAV